MGAEDHCIQDPTLSPLELRVTDDKMHVLLTHRPPLPGLTTLLDRVEAALGTLPFTRPFARSQWESRVAQAAVLGEIRNVPIMSGTPPVPPVHGRVEWIADFFSTGFVIDEATGRADYRRRAAQNSVENGQLLARIVPPVIGTDGTDVFGRKVHVDKARPAKLRAGPNVRIDEAEGTVHAEATGRIRLHDGLVSVDEVVTIDGSVGLETGHVRHPGALVVRGDIETDSQVETRGDIEVTGVVEPSRIITDGDLVVHGGITGAEGKRIVAATVRAKFLLDVEIEASGDVIVETEILHSRITARGAVSCVRGRIVGGQILAQGGIEAAQVGSDAGARTLLSAGEDLDRRARLAEWNAALADWKRQRDRIASNIAPLKAHADRLDPNVREALQKLEAQVAHIDAEMAAAQEQKRRLREGASDRCRPQVYVFQRAFPECFLVLGEERIRFTETLEGPMCIENVGEGIRSRILQGAHQGSRLLDGANTNRHQTPAAR